MSRREYRMSCQCHVKQVIKAGQRSTFCRYISSPVRLPEEKNLIDRDRDGEPGTVLECRTADCMDYDRDLFECFNGCSF